MQGCVSYRIQVGVERQCWHGEAVMTLLCVASMPTMLPQGAALLQPLPSKLCESRCNSRSWLTSQHVASV